LKGNKTWANNQLKYGIRLLQNDPACGGGPFSGALALAISIKQSLAFVGWIWQAERLENWINKARANHGFLVGKYSVDRLRPSEKADSAKAEGASF
jgi:hypothetical protein